MLIPTREPWLLISRDYSLINRINSIYASKPKKETRRFKDVVKFTKTMLPSRNLKPRACFNHATVNDALIISTVIILNTMESLSSDVDKISVF